MAAQYEIWLLDPYGNLLEIVDDWIYLNYDRALNNIGSLELGLDGSYANPTFIKIDGRIVVWRNGQMDTETTWIIRRIVETLNTDGTLTISIGAFSGNEILLRRLVAYDDGTSYASKTDQADDMMKQVVRENYSASASNTARQISTTYFTIENDSSLGPSITKEFGWNNVMDICQDISLTTISAGSSVYFDVVSPQYNTFEFRTYRSQRGLDHRSSGGITPVILSPDRGNLTNVVRSFDYSGEATYIYAGGRGYNQFRYIGSASSSDRINISPFGLRELFINAGQENVATAVDNAALSGLRENRPQRVFHGEIVNIPSSTEYGVHWGFGDLVTIEFEGETIDCSVDVIKIEVKGGMETIKASLRALET